jgi:hypothetical protein
MLRSLVSYNSTIVTLIHEHIRYEVFKSKEILGKFLNHDMMVKDSKYVENMAYGNMTTSEPQAVVFKATEENEEGATSKGLPVDPSKLNDEEMSLIIKSFRKILKTRKGKTTGLIQRGFATIVVSLIITSQNVHMLAIVTGMRTRRRRRRWRRSSSTRRWTTKHTSSRNGTLTRAPSTRTSPLSPSTRESSSPTSITSASWPKRAKRR